MDRKNKAPAFVDAMTSDLGGKRAAKFFERCEKAIPWEELSRPLKTMYSNNMEKPKKAAPPIGRPS